MHLGRPTLKSASCSTSDQERSSREWPSRTQESRFRLIRVHPRLIRRESPSSPAARPRSGTSPSPARCRSWAAARAGTSGCSGGHGDRSALPGGRARGTQGERRHHPAIDSGTGCPGTSVPFIRTRCSAGGPGGRRAVPRAARRARGRRDDSGPARHHWGALHRQPLAGQCAGHG